MTYKSAIRPLCRYCGKGIAKKTTRHCFGQATHNAPTRYWVNHTETPANKAEAQRYLNEAIVSVRGGYGGLHCGTWDGESWEDEFFCTGECAKGFGYFAMRHPAAQTKAYADAVRKQRATK